MALSDKGRLRITNKTLQLLQVPRSWVYTFYVDHVNPGVKIPFDSDQNLINTTRKIQQFVFGDPGDVAMGLAPQPATPEEVDGALGPLTARRMQTYLESLTPDTCVPDTASSTVDYLVISGERIQIENVRIISLDEAGSLSFPRDCRSCYGTWPKSAEWNLLATDHWDATLSAKACFRILKSRKLSSTFGVDNPAKDGVSTIYQWLDPGFNYGYHAGSKANRKSLVSFDLSNAVYTKYAAKYRKEVGIDRPVIQAEFHGQRKQILGMYKGQIIAMLRIKKVLSERYGIPLQYPVDEDGRPVTTVFEKALDAKAAYQGCVTHLHLSRNKFDVAGLEHQIIALLLSNGKLFEEFPMLVENFRLHDEGWAEWLDGVKQTWTWKELWG